MARYRITFGFNTYVFGGSETYYSGDVSVTNLSTQLQVLIDRRNAILPNSYNWVGVRISNADGLRQSTLLPPGTYTIANAGFNLVIPPKGLYPGNTVDSGADQARATAQMVLGYGAGRKVTRYLFGVPDDLLYAEPASINANNVPGWFAKFEAYRTELTSGRWNVRARLRDGAYAPRTIVGWTQSTTAPTNIGFVLPSASAAGIAVGDRIAISNVRRLGTDKLSYNGQYFVDAINTTLIPDNVVFYLRGTEDGDPNSIKLMGKVALVGYGYQSIDSAFLSRAGIRKRGKPFVTPRGRRLSRAKLDP